MELLIHDLISFVALDVMVGTQSRAKKERPGSQHSLWGHAAKGQRPPIGKYLLPPSGGHSRSNYSKYHACVSLALCTVDYNSRKVGQLWSLILPLLVQTSSFAGMCTGAHGGHRSTQSWPQVNLKHCLLVRSSGWPSHPACEAQGSSCLSLFSSRLHTPSRSALFLHVGPESQTGILVVFSKLLPSERSLQP